MGTRTPSQRGTDNLAPTPITVPLRKMRKTPHPNNTPIEAGRTYGVHHTTSPDNAQRIVQTGKFLPRNNPNKMPLFGYSVGGYFSFERDPRTAQYYRQVMQQGKAETVAASITPQRPLVVRNFREQSSSANLDLRIGTRIALVEAIAEQLTPDERATYNDIVDRAIKRFNRATLELESVERIERFAPSKIKWNEMHIEAMREVFASSDNVMQSAVNQLKAFGYDSLWITQPPSIEGGDDLVAGSQVLVLDPKITRVMGIRPE